MGHSEKGSAALADILFALPECLWSIVLKKTGSSADADKPTRHV